jgi:hypothetical protein
VAENISFSGLSPENENFNFPLRPQRLCGDIFVRIFSLLDAAIHYKATFLGFRNIVRTRPVKATPAHIKNANR